MQLIVEHDLNRPLKLPNSYNYMMQSIIYHAIGDNELSGMIHDKGFNYEKRKFRLFVFSLLKGRYSVERGSITFHDHVGFEVRSPDILLLHSVADSFKSNGINYRNSYHADNVSVVTDDITVEGCQVFIRMRTGISVYRTDPVTRDVYYLNPLDEDFAEMINANFVRKYIACYGVRPESGVMIEPWQLDDNDKVVTRYKGRYITGWKGVYRLSGERKYLDFLYQTGIGSKNSQGFGMFDIIV